MTIKYHCRTCDKQELAEVNLEEIMNNRKTGEQFTDLIISKIERDHAIDCREPNIGIRST